MKDSKESQNSWWKKLGAKKQILILRQRCPKERTINSS